MRSTPDVSPCVEAYQSDMAERLILQLFSTARGIIILRDVLRSRLGFIVNSESCFSGNSHLWCWNSWVNTPYKQQTDEWWAWEGILSSTCGESAFLWSRWMIHVRKMDFFFIVWTEILFCHFDPSGCPIVLLHVIQIGGFEFTGRIFPKWKW